MAQVTQEVFNKHLRMKKHHDEFVENGDTLMSKLEDLKISRARGCAHTFGFVIPSLDNHTRKEILKLLNPRKWTAVIDVDAKVIVDTEAFAYTHIRLNA